jgi:hypothetical protein
MFIRRAKYEQRIRDAVDEALATCRSGHGEFASTAQRIATEQTAQVRAFAAEAINRAEARTAAAESTLQQERQQHHRDMRHVMSMFLRREKTIPLPPTKEEKAEARTEAEEQKKQPVPLTDVQIAMRDANRREAARYGVSEDDADKDFEEKILKQMMD